MKALRGEDFSSVVRNSAHSNYIFISVLNLPGLGQLFGAGEPNAKKACGICQFSSAPAKNN